MVLGANRKGIRPHFLMRRVLLCQGSPASYLPSDDLPPQVSEGFTSYQLTTNYLVLFLPLCFLLFFLLLSLFFCNTVYPLFIAYYKTIHCFVLLGRKRELNSKTSYNLLQGVISIQSESLFRPLFPWSYFAFFSAPSPCLFAKPDNLLLFLV